MLLRQDVLDGIRDGRITLAFRRWRRPTVRNGGTLMTAAGQLEIVSVERIDVGDITAAEARRAGFDTVAAVVSALGEGDGEVYRIALGALRADPRVALRESAELTEAERASLKARLERLDAHAADGPWTRRTLELIAKHPGVRAGDLCRQMKQEMVPFKRNVRKLKALGLTESLEVGYRLSPRGRAYLRG